MSNYKAASIHLLISLSVVTAFFLVVWFIWYPDPILTMEGGFKIITILMGVDVTLGPFMTLILFKPGKKGLYFDLTTIAAIQIAAFLYGVNVIYQERPQYLVFNADRFTIAHASEIDMNELKDKSLTVGFFAPPRIVYTELPKDPKLLEQIMWESVSGGKDLHQRPELYERISDKFKLLATDNRQLTFKSFKQKYPDIVALITNHNKLDETKVILYPIIGKQKDGVMVLNKQSPEAWSVYICDPWIIKQQKDNK